MTSRRCRGWCGYRSAKHASVGASQPSWVPSDSYQQSIYLPLGDRAYPRALPASRLEGRDQAEALSELCWWYGVSSSRTAISKLPCVLVGKEICTVVQLRETARTRIGQLQAYLGRCNVEEVQRRRDQFGAVVLQGRTGLKVAADLSRLDDLADVSLDPADYRQAPSANSTKGTLPGLETPPFDWIAAQIRLGMSIVRTPSPRIRVGRLDEVKVELSKSYCVPVSVVLALDCGWLGKRHIDSLIKELESADRDVSLVFSAPFDPLATSRAIAGLRQLLAWASASGKRVELLRTDLAALPAVLEGAAVGAVGLSTTTRHLSQPLTSKQRKEYEHRQVSPLVFVPRLLHWQRGSHLGALSPWKGAGVTDCDCTVCKAANDDLLRFTSTYESVPVHVQQELNDHCALALSMIFRRVMESENPAASLANLQAEALSRARFITASLKVHLDPPPAWISSWV